MFMQQELTPEQRLQKCSIQIMGEKRYIAQNPVFMVGTKAIVDDHPTAFTDGRNERYGRKWVEMINDAEFRWTLLHETKHKMYRHLITYVWLWLADAEVANWACDYFINLEIEDENPDGFAVMPRDENGQRMCLYDERFRGKAIPEIFTILMKEKKEDPEKSAQDNQATMDEHGWDEAEQMSNTELSEHVQEVEQAIATGLVEAEKLKAAVPQNIKELLKPKIRWMDVLREFITNTCRGDDDASWRIPERRAFVAGILRPTPFSESVGELIVAGDMSYSMDKILPVVLTEIKGIGEQVLPDTLRLLYWDTSVCGDEVYGQGGKPIADMIKSTKPTGGGGTNPSCVSDYIKANGLTPQAVIVITDGYVSDSRWGTWDCPVLWCIIDNKNVRPPVGKVVHVTTEG